jgi:hypothetical protein
MSFAIVCFKWRGGAHYRSKYEAAHVNTLRRMFARHLQMPHDFMCITDDASGLDEGIRVVPLWKDHGDIPSPHGPGEPSCFRRLRLFAKDAGEIVGAKRFAWCDLDVVLTGDVTPIFNRPEPIVLLPGSSPTIPFNGSMVLMDAGCRPEVWETFDPDTSPQRNVAAKCLGSDQGHISFCLKDKGEAQWKPGPEGDGIYFFHRHSIRGDLPKDARLVSFHGRGDPWSERFANINWIRRHYR